MQKVYIVFIVVYVVVTVRRVANRNLRRMKKLMPALLLEHSAYYRKLNLKERTHFEERVLRFIATKHFYRFDTKAKTTDEMQILIAAAAMQITFGYSEEYDYETFRRIAISDKDYISSKTMKMHQGETNPGKSLIAFSWERFMFGIKNPHDSINLGLHEFAHALFVNNVHGFTNHSFKKAIGKWHKIVNKIIEEGTADDFFRRYAFVNKMEFFAVSMEYFFENPQAFESHLPELYGVMCELLNQNPLKPNNGIVRKTFLSSLYNR